MSKMQSSNQIYSCKGCNDSYYQDKEEDNSGYCTTKCYINISNKLNESIKQLQIERQTARGVKLTAGDGQSVGKKIKSSNSKMSCCNGDVRGMCFTCLGDLDKITLKEIVEVRKCPNLYYAVAYWLHNNFQVTTLTSNYGITLWEFWEKRRDIVQYLGLIIRAEDEKKIHEAIWELEHDEEEVCQECLEEEIDSDDEKETIKCVGCEWNIPKNKRTNEIHPDFCNEICYDNFMDNAEKILNGRRRRNATKFYADRQRAIDIFMATCDA